MFSYTPPPEQPEVVPENEPPTLLKRNVLLKKNGWKIAAVAVCGITLLIIPLAIWVNTTEQEQQASTIEIPTPPKPKIDPTWLEDPQYCAKEGRSILHCYHQMRLRLTNLDLDSGNLGLIPSYMGKEGYRYRAMASQFIRNPDYRKCHRQSEEVCLQSFAPNILVELEKAETNSDYIVALSKYLALSDGRFGEIPTRTTPDRHLALRIVEKFESDVALYYGQANSSARRTRGEAYQYTDKEEDRKDGNSDN